MKAVHIKKQFYYQTNLLKIVTACLIRCSCELPNNLVLLKQTNLLELMNIKSFHKLPQFNILLLIVSSVTKILKEINILRGLKWILNCKKKQITLQN